MVGTARPTKMNVNWYIDYRLTQNLRKILIGGEIRKIGGEILINFRE